MLSPGTAYLLAYLPAFRLAYLERLALFERNAATIDPKLKHAIEFSRDTLKLEEVAVSKVDRRIADLATGAGIALPPVPTTAGFPAWLDALPGRMAAHLTTTVLQAASTAGETARRVSVAAHVASDLAHLRCGAPDNADLRSQAEERAAELTTSAAELTTKLEATDLPLVKSQADNVAKMVSLTSDLTPATVGGYRQLNELVRDLDNFLESKVRQLDAAPPPAVASAPTAAEVALLQRLIAAPGDRRLREDLAALADKRNDQRARLIRLQLAHPGDDQPPEALDIIRSHPEWTTRLVELGARDIKFAGGFPAEIKVDADVLLSRGRELLAAAPLTRLRVRGAKGRIREIVQSPLLQTIEMLDLDDQGVTDDDVTALGASPHAGRLRQLDLRYNPLSGRGIEALAASPHLKQLEVVNLDGNPADPVDRLEYYDETNQHAVPTEAGKALEAKYGKLRWLRRA